MNHHDHLSTEALHTITLLIYRERREIDPPVSQAQRLCILLHCLYLYIYKGDEPPWSIEHGVPAYCYTAYIYREKGDRAPSQVSSEALHTATLLIFIYRREMNPLVIQARRLSYHYTAYI